MSETFEERLHAVEFILAHLVSKVIAREEIQKDIRELKGIVETGNAWRLMPELTPSQAKDTIESAIELLDDSLFFQLGGSA